MRPHVTVLGKLHSPHRNPTKRSIGHINKSIAGVARKYLEEYLDRLQKSVEWGLLLRADSKPMAVLKSSTLAEL